jgi:hypothetical protein
MTPEQLVPTLETCLKLKDAGYRQDLTFLFFQNMDNFTSLKYPEVGKGWQVRDRAGCYWFDSCIAAPTLQELLEELPDWTVCFYNDVEYVVRGNIKAFEPIEQSHPNPAEAAALLWLELQKEFV